MMKHRDFLKVLVLMGCVLTLFVTTWTHGDALPAGLYEAVQSSLGEVDWTLNGRAFGEQQQLVASDGADFDNFGISVAIDGDTALIGAHFHDVGANAIQGAAYVFVRNGATWTQQQKLTASDGEIDNRFGISVALDGDTALVGSFLADVGANDSQGAAYVFERSGTIWTEQTKLIAGDGTTGDYFGEAVALEADRALIGAPNTNIDGIAGQGAAYLFERNGEFWFQQAKLTASDGAVFDNFGSSVALDQGTALIGASQDAIGTNTEQGSAYVFVGSGSNWVEQQKLIAPDGAEEDRFGYAVALAEDTAVIGSRNDVIGANSGQGSAYVFVRSETTWSLQVKLTAADGAAGDSFGTSVAIEDDLVVIGALGDDADATTNQGSAYVFARNGTTWSFQSKLTASDGGESDSFGVSAAIDGDSVLVGAVYDDVAANENQGSAYVFTDPELAPTSTPEIPPETPTPDVPTETATPEIPELIQNGGFETVGGDGKPDVTPWTIKNASGDKAKCNKDKDGDGIPDKIVAFAGNCAFQFKNVVGEAGKLEQNVDLSAIVPDVGDGLNLSFFAQSKGSATVKAKVVFKYSDDTKTKISVESSGAEVYTEFTGSETLTSADIVKSKISFKSAQTSGKVYVDDVSLLHTTTSGLIAVPGAKLSNSTR